MRQRRGHLITVAQLKRIEEVEPDRCHANHDLPFCGGRIRDLFDAKLLRSAELAELRHAHGCFLAPTHPPSRRLWHKPPVKSKPGSARGFFAIGIEGVSKAVNLGNLLRSAHAFGASFAFTIGADPRAMDTIADTSRASSHLPLYHWQSIDELRLPRDCRLVGIELLDEAVDCRPSPTQCRQ